MSSNHSPTLFVFIHEWIHRGILNITLFITKTTILRQDIFRKYPNKYETIISTLCENLDSLDEPEARAAMIWIVGEYAERIDNADEILQSFLDGFHDENTQVNILTDDLK